MTQARHEIEVHGTVGEPVTLPLVARPPGPADPAYAWTLELPEGVAEVDDPTGIACAPTFLAATSSSRPRPTRPAWRSRCCRCV